jgi:hypothetical protein
MLNIGAILISCKILVEHEEPAWMYRENTNLKDDSGWRVFSGSEDENYLTDPSNFKLISANQLIEIDENIKVNLLAPIGSSFEKDDKKNWVIVEKGIF